MNAWRYAKKLARSGSAKEVRAPGTPAHIDEHPRFLWAPPGWEIKAVRL